MTALTLSESIRAFISRGSKLYLLKPATYTMTLQQLVVVTRSSMTVHTCVYI